MDYCNFENAIYAVAIYSGYSIKCLKFEEHAVLGHFRILIVHALCSFSIILNFAYEYKVLIDQVFKVSNIYMCVFIIFIISNFKHVYIIHRKQR